MITGGGLVGRVAQVTGGTRPGRADHRPGERRSPPASLEGGPVGLDQRRPSATRASSLLGLIQDNQNVKAGGASSSPPASPTRSSTCTPASRRDPDRRDQGRRRVPAAGEPAGPRRALRRPRRARRRDRADRGRLVIFTPADLRDRRRRSSSSRCSCSSRSSRSSRCSARSSTCVPVVVVALGLLGGAVPGAVAGFAAGLLIDASLGGTLGVCVAVADGAGYLAGRWRESYDIVSSWCRRWSTGALTRCRRGRLRRALQLMLGVDAPDQPRSCCARSSSRGCSASSSRLPVFPLIRRILRPALVDDRRPIARAETPVASLGMSRLMFRPEEQRPMNAQFAVRVAVLSGIALVVFAAIFFRLWYLEVLSGEEYLKQAEDNRVRRSPIQAPRGEILDRNRPGAGRQPDGALAAGPCRPAADSGPRRRTTSCDELAQVSRDPATRRSRRRSASRPRSCRRAR